MPPPSSTAHLPSSHPATRQRPKSPTRVLAEAEAQWIFSEAELANTPSIQDGMQQKEEHELRAKGVNFIVQVGIMLKLPQLTLSTAAVFFQRFLMRASLKSRHNGIPKLHHYKIAATALFLATKVEESCRRVRELVVAFCRVAQKNPNLQVDEATQDFWQWKDCIMNNEDVLLEVLCFDLTVESPHRQLYDMLKFYGLEHNKRLRNAAWSFVTDSNNTEVCLLHNSRTIAMAAVYAACRSCEVALPDDSNGRPWWEAQDVKLKEIRSVIEYMCKNYDPATKKANGNATTTSSEGDKSIYVGLSTPNDGGSDEGDCTRLKDEQAQDAHSPFVPPGSERRTSNASSVGFKRERDEPQTNGDQPHSNVNGVVKDEKDAKRPRLEPIADDNDPHDVKVEEEKIKVEYSNKVEEETAEVKREVAEASEEGEVEE